MNNLNIWRTRNVTCSKHSAAFNLNSYILINSYKTVKSNPKNVKYVWAPLASTIFAALFSVFWQLFHLYVSLCCITIVIVWNILVNFVVVNIMTSRIHDRLRNLHRSALKFGNEQTSFIDRLIFLYYSFFYYDYFLIFDLKSRTWNIFYIRLYIFFCPACKQNLLLCCKKWLRLKKFVNAGFHRVRPPQFKLRIYLRCHCEHA